MSIRYAERLADARIDSSVGSVGDSYENALAETINSLYKTEVIRQQGPWKNIEWVDWFNNRRTYEPIGNVPPAEKEIEYYQQLEGSSHGGLTQTNESPEIPGRFKSSRGMQESATCLPAGTGHR